jgi:hypothetical protein
MIEQLKTYQCFKEECAPVDYKGNEDFIIRMSHALSTKWQKIICVKPVALVIVLSVLFSINSEAKLHEPTQSKYFNTEDAGFIIEENKGVIYILRLLARKNIKKDMYGTAFFENPSDENSPLTFDFKMLKGDKRVLVKSPIVKEVENNRSYEVKVLLYKDATREKVASIHNQYIEFKIPSKVAQIKGIKLISSSNNGIRPNHFRVSGWSLLLQKSKWKEGTSKINNEQYLVHYIKTDDTLENWSLILTSHTFYTHIEADWLYDYTIKDLAKDCPSFIYEVIEKTPGSIIFEWSNTGCNGNPAIQEIKKIVNQNKYVYSISLTSKNDQWFEQFNKHWIKYFKSIKAIL